MAFPNNTPNYSNPGFNPYMQNMFPTYPQVHSWIALEF